VTTDYLCKFAAVPLHPWWKHGPGPETIRRRKITQMRNAEVIRQWQVLREIETRRAGVTIHELASLVSVSTRTIRRDLQALQEAGFAVYDEGEENETKRWRLDGAPFKAVQDGLSVSDVAALYLSRTVVEGLSGWPLEDELRTAFEKLERASSSPPCPRSSRPRPVPAHPHTPSGRSTPRGGSLTPRATGALSRCATSRQRPIG
jgi:hypothetical protein